MLSSIVTRRVQFISSSSQRPPPESPGREERGDSVKNAMEAKDSCYRRSIAVKWVVEESGTPDAVILRLRAAKV